MLIIRGFLLVAWGLQKQLFPFDIKEAWTIFFKGEFEEPQQLSSSWLAPSQYINLPLLQILMFCDLAFQSIEHVVESECGTCEYRGLTVFLTLLYFPGMRTWLMKHSFQESERINVYFLASLLEGGPYILLY